MDTHTLISNRSEGVSLRLNRLRLKIDAGLSAMCSRLNLIPTKVLAQLTNVSKLVESDHKKFYVRLIVNPDNSFVVKLDKPPFNDVIRTIRKTRSDESQRLEQLKTACETYGVSLSTAMGSYNSFN